MKMIQMIIHCWFCGSSKTHEMPETWKRKVLPGCENCYIKTNDKKGSKVIYAGWRRNPSGAVYADKSLQRDQAYTIKKVTQWQQGCYVELVETGNATFDHSLFVPATFDLSKIVCAYPPGMEPEKPKEDQ